VVDENPSPQALPFQGVRKPVEVLRAGRADIAIIRKAHLDTLALTPSQNAGIPSSPHIPDTLASWDASTQQIAPARERQLKLLKLSHILTRNLTEVPAFRYLLATCEAAGSDGR